MTKASNAEAVEQYISSFNSNVQAHLREIRHWILQNAPTVEEKMNYGIAAFALIDGGKRDQQIMIAGFKKHVGFYPGPDVIAAFADRFGGLTFAKGSVQFPLDQPLPRELIVAMIQHKVATLNGQG